MLCDSRAKAETLLQSREKGQTPVLKTIIIMDSFDSELVERGAKSGVDIVSMQDVEVLLAQRGRLSGVYAMKCNVCSVFISSPGSGQK